MESVTRVVGRGARHYLFSTCQKTARKLEECILKFILKAALEDFCGCYWVKTKLFK
jgi:hypothetical protein